MFSARPDMTALSTLGADVCGVEAASGQVPCSCGPVTETRWLDADRAWLKCLACGTEWPIETAA